MGHIRRFDGDGGWEGCTPEPYVDGARCHVLVGASDGATQVELRVFEIPAGGASTLDRHAHEHAILVLTGRALLVLDEEVHEIGPGDHAFIGAWQIHRLTTLGSEPLRFVCTAPALRGTTTVDDPMRAATG